MEKLSINGKSFDEIFEQRGKEVQVSDMAGHGVYFAEDVADKNQLHALIEYAGLTHDNTGTASYCILFFDGEFIDNYNEPCDYAPFGDIKYLETTPDQVALLNIYNHGKAI